MPSDRAILMTPAGPGAIAMVRIVGAGVAGFLGTHFSKLTRVGRCMHGELQDERGGVIDDPVVVLLPDDRGADINLHGGPWVVQATLDLAQRAGFAVVTGEDALNDPAAVDADDRLEAEMLAALPLASTELAVMTLLAQPALWASFLASKPSAEQVREIESDRSLWWLLNPPRVAIIGAPNVGKSTLANQLFGQERSITADVPGTTRDWVGELANIDGLAVMLVDTPGIRQTHDDIEREAIGRASGQIRAAELVVIVMDVTQPVDRSLIDAHPNAIRVANKCDLKWAWDAKELKAMPISAQSGEGLDHLRTEIRQRFVTHRTDQVRCWTQRQRDWLASLTA